MKFPRKHKECIMLKQMFMAGILPAAAVFTDCAEPEVYHAFPK